MDFDFPAFCLKRIEMSDFEMLDFEMLDLEM